MPVNYMQLKKVLSGGKEIVPADKGLGELSEKYQDYARSYQWEQ